MKIQSYCLFRFSLTFLFLLLSVGMMSAQDASAILKKTENAFRQSKSVAVDYTFKAQKESGRGVIHIKGNKFMNKMPEQTVWFNGKTMWTLVRANEEVNVTTPTPAQVAAMNPYSFLTLYKNGYNAKVTGTTTTEYVVTLTPKAKNKQDIILRVNRKSYLPSQISLNHGSVGNITITIKSLKKNQKFADSSFSFNAKAYPDYEVIDLR